MVDESLYLTTHETALAVVATSMKKARLPIDTLVVNSIVGGLLFSTGGMLHVLVQAYCPVIYENDPGLIQLLQGLVYPIGLFYVVIMGVDLFNSNILFFSVGVVRGAVSIVDLLSSWLVSWWFNLVGNIFVCYIICHFSHISKSESFIKASVAIVMHKAEFSFVETLLKGIAGNFYVCLAIYLQLMAKPLHVKFLMMVLPVFSFVAMGFTHSVADMYLLTIGLINHAPISVGKVAWKIMLPGALGNIIGGSFFGIVIPWYLHLVVVERDQKLLKLPKYEVRDEQPELNIDSRVVRQKSTEPDEFQDEVMPFGYDEKRKLDDIQEYTSSGSSYNNVSPNLFNSMIPVSENLAKVSSRMSEASRYSTRSSYHKVRSPKNVFPVYGMGPPLEREQAIASGANIKSGGYDGNADQDSVYTARTELNDPVTPSAEYVGDQLKRIITGRKSTSGNSIKRRQSDIESQMSGHLPSKERRQSSASILSKPFRRSPVNNSKDHDPLGRSKNIPIAADTGYENASIDITPIKSPAYSGSFIMSRSDSRIIDTEVANQSNPQSPSRSRRESTIGPNVSFANAGQKKILSPSVDSSSFNIVNYQPGINDGGNRQTYDSNDTSKVN